MIQVNYLAILLAGVASMVVGFVWYSPVLFAKPWSKLMGYTPDSMKKMQKEMGKMYGISFVLSLVTAYILAHVMALSFAYFQYPMITTGLNSALWMWIGFIMPVQATDVLFGRKAFKLFAINTGYQLVSLLVMGIVIAVV